MKRIGLLIMMALLASCEKEDMGTESLGENVGIVGTWIEGSDISLPLVEDGTTRLTRSEGLDQFRYGFTINEDGAFLERKNAGWCGTPPISYDNFEGTWIALSDSLLQITVGYWGGTMSYQIRIVSLDKETLRIRYLYAESLTDTK
ncbi:MAG: hypothetical protein V2B15_01265 [Bacteroidota bacterium]